MDNALVYNIKRKLKSYIIRQIFSDEDREIIQDSINRSIAVGLNKRHLDVNHLMKQRNIINIFKDKA